jgi:hypothetical protein
MKGGTLGNSMSKLFKNDGSGNFSEVIGSPFVGSFYGDVAFADVDNDNDEDVLISGYNSGIGSHSKLYLNDGSGNYTELFGTPFAPISSSGTVNFGDVDNDGDFDVIITGGVSFGSLPIAKLYENNGNGSYQEVTGQPFIGVQQSSVAFAFVDNDNKLDLLISGNSGSDNSGQRITKLYINRSAVGLSDIESNLGVNMYPVPTDGTLTIEFEESIMLQEIIVRDIEGKICQSSYEHLGEKIKLEIAGTSGIYFVEIITNDFSIIKRVTKE